MNTTASADAATIAPNDAPVLPPASVFETRFVMLANGLASVLIVIALLAYGVQARPGGWAGIDATTPLHDAAPAPEVMPRHG